MNRNKKIIINMMLSVCIKGFGMILALFLMPAYMEYFHNQQVLGLWFTLLSVLNWILTFDFGIGNGLRNRLAVAAAKKETSEERALISTTYWLSILIAFVFFLGCYAAVSLVNWNSFFNISVNIIDISVLKKVVFIVLIGIIFQFVLKIITSILLAMQMPSIANSLGFISNLIILVAVLSIKTTDDSSNLIVLSYVYLVASNLPLLIMTIIAFSTFMKDSRPSLKMIDRHMGLAIVKLGMGFFILQILSLALFNMKEFLITWTTAPNLVVEFQVYNRIFNFIVTIAWIALIPIWSAVTEAYTKRDYSWIGSVYQKLKKLMLIVMFFVVILIFSMQPLVDFWLGENAIEIQKIYSIAFGIYCILYIWWGVVASISNGTGKIKTQLVLSVVGVIINFTMSIIFVHIFNSWIGVIYANIISMLPYCIIEPFNINKIINGGKHES